MPQYLGHKIRIYPNKEAVAYLESAFDISRFAYNWGLASWQTLYQHGEKTNFFVLDKKFNEVKHTEFPWVTNVSKHVTAGAFQNLEDAFKRFFEGSSKYPKFKKKDNCPEKAFFGKDAIRLSGKYIKLPHCKGIIKLSKVLRFKGDILSVVIRRESDQWFASFQIKLDDLETYKHTCENQASVGIDLGLKTLVTCSDGTTFENSRILKKYSRKLKRQQRSLSRKANGSKNRAKAKKVLAKTHLKVSQLRLDSLHKISAYLVKNFRYIVIEDLNVAGMLANHKLARAISDACFGELRRQLEYKAILSGSRIIVADRFFPSSKLCSHCGHKLDKLSLSIRNWECPKCGSLHDRDYNASKNLENLLAVGITESLNVCGESVSRDLRKKTSRFSMKQKSQVKLLEISEGVTR